MRGGAAPGESTGGLHPVRRGNMEVLLEGASGGLQSNLLLRVGELLALDPRGSVWLSLESLN